MQLKFFAFGKKVLVGVTTPPYPPQGGNIRPCYPGVRIPPLRGVGAIEFHDGNNFFQ